MPKKGNKPSYTSKGKHSTANRGTLAAVRADREAVDVSLNILKAYEAGRNPWVTVDNPDPKNTNRRRYKVKANSLWGNPKERRAYNIYGNEAKKDMKKAASK